MQCRHLVMGFLLCWATPIWAQAQNYCIPPDPDYCVTRVCQAGEGDCDPGQCARGLSCVNDVGAQYGLPAHYDVCEGQSTEGPRADPDYCVNNYCGIGEGDCDPGQCDEGTCVNDVGAEYGLPAHYDVCEAGSTTTPTTSGVGQFVGTWQFTNSQTTQTYQFALESCSDGPCVAHTVSASDIALIVPESIAGYSYVMLHIDGNVCRAYGLYEPTGNTVQGHYGDAFGSCGSEAVLELVVTDILVQRYPTTGRRISQSTASDSIPQSSPPPVNPEETIEQLMEALMGMMP